MPIIILQKILFKEYMDLSILKLNSNEINKAEFLHSYRYFLITYNFKYSGISNIASGSDYDKKEISHNLYRRFWAPGSGLMS